MDENNSLESEGEVDQVNGEVDSQNDNVEEANLSKENIPLFNFSVEESDKSRSEIDVKSEKSEGHIKLSNSKHIYKLSAILNEYSNAKNYFTKVRFTLL